MDQKDKKQQMKDWLKRIGVLGFLFFLIKGLVWLAVIYGVGKFFK